MDTTVNAHFTDEKTDRKQLSPCGHLFFSFQYLLEGDQKGPEHDVFIQPCLPGLRMGTGGEKRSLVPKDTFTENNAFLIKNQIQRT